MSIMTRVFLWLVSDRFNTGKVKNLSKKTDSRLIISVGTATK